MAVSSAVVAVTSTATLLSGTDPGDVSGAANGQQLQLNNTGATSVFLGGAGVTTTTGYTLAAGAQLRVELEGKEALYAIAAATGTVGVLRTGV